MSVVVASAARMVLRLPWSTLVALVAVGDVRESSCYGSFSSF